MRTFIPCFILPISESGRVTVFVSGLNSEYIIAVFSIPGSISPLLIRIAKICETVGKVPFNSKTGAEVAPGF